MYMNEDIITKIALHAAIKRADEICDGQNASVEERTRTIYAQLKLALNELAKMQTPGSPKPFYPDANFEEGQIIKKPGI